MLYNVLVMKLERDVKQGGSWHEFADVPYFEENDKIHKD